MNRKQVAKLRTTLDNMRKSPNGLKSAELQSIAKQTGRKLSSRGKEPTFIRENDPYLRPLSIPNHGTLKSGTARSIIDSLLSDLDEWTLKFVDEDDDDQEP